LAVIDSGRGKGKKKKGEKRRETVKVLPFRAVRYNAMMPEEKGKNDAGAMSRGFFLLWCAGGEGKGGRGGEERVLYAKLS